MTKTQIETLCNQARDGMRILAVVNGKTTTLWAGLGNRAGLHGFAEELLSERWRKGSKRFISKLERLPKLAVVQVYWFRNVTRDRGRWVLNANYPKD